MIFKPYTQENIDKCRKKDPLYQEGGVCYIMFGYDVFEKDELVGCIVIINRGGFITLDGYNYAEQSAIGFIKAMKHTLKFWDEVFDRPLMIMREVKRVNLTNIYKRFGFELKQEIEGWYLYLRETHEETD